MNRDLSKYATPALCALLIALTLAAFWPVRTHDFINFDDGLYVNANPMVQAGFTTDSVRWAFTSSHASNWHPLTWLSHMLDCQLFGLNAGAHHLTNLFLHAANMLLLLWLLVRMTGAWGRSLVVAGLFALHPLHVESVAWIAERKDLLSAFFGLLCLLAYVRYVSESKVQSPKSKAAYALALVFFALGLMSKPMLVTWPFVMLLLDYWPLRRFERSTLNPHPSTLPRLLLEKLPFLGLTIASSIVTFLVQERTGAVASLDMHPLGSRMMNAITAYAGYIWKTLWPANLSIMYLPPEQRDVELVLFAGLLLCLATGFVLFKAAKWRFLPTGWFWYLGALVPVIGLVQVGNQAMADRYTYLPSIGLFIVAAWGGWELLARRSWGRAVAGVTAVIILLGCAWATRQQVLLWRDSETLFTHCLRVTKDNYIIHNNLGTALMLKGRFDEARPHYEEALRLRPLYSEALNNMGVLLTREGRVSEALPLLEAAVRLSHRRAGVYGELAVALAFEGRFEDAINYYQLAIAAKPDSVEAHNNLAWIFATHPEARHRNGAEAVRLAEQACKLSDYKKAILIGTLGAAYAEAGRFEDAIAAAEKAAALAVAAGDTALADKNRELTALYRQGQPYRETPPTFKQKPESP